MIQILLGKSVLEIWNETSFSNKREVSKFTRTVVLVKSNDLTEVVVFEYDKLDTIQNYLLWEWNKMVIYCGD